MTQLYTAVSMAPLGPIVIEGVELLVPPGGYQLVTLPSGRQQLVAPLDFAANYAPASSGGALVKIGEVVLGSAAASVAFTNIPQNYRHLRLVTKLRCDVSATQSGLMQFNGDAASDYSWEYLQGSSSTATAANLVGQSGAYAGVVPGASSPAGTFSSNDILLADYTGAALKTALTLAGSSGAAFAFMLAAQWSGTTAITALTILSSTGNLVAGSMVSLYGVQ